jgi:hypothetical protein
VFHSAASPLAYNEAFLPIVDAVDPGPLALLTQQDEQPEIAEAPDRISADQCVNVARSWS